MTPEQRIARQQKQAEADIRRAILGQETFEIKALDEGDAHSIVPDKTKFTRDIAVASWMDGINGKDNIPGTMDWQANKDALAQEYFKQDVRGISDDDFAGLVRDHITAQSAFADVAFTAAAKETPLSEAIKEARDKSGLFGIGHKFAANQGRYLADFTRQYADTKEKLFPYREQINQLTEMGRGAEERIVAGEGSPWEDMAKVMLTIPAEDREDVLHAIAAQGKQEGETQKDAFTRTVLAFDRGLERYVMTAGEGMRDIGFTALMAGAAAESAEARRFGAPAEMPESFIRPEEEQQMDFLKRQMRDLSRGSLDPLDRVELLGMSISGAAENLPMMATSFIPYVGPAMMLGSFKAETEYQLRQQYPEMDSATVEGFSMLASPFQAASEVIGDRLLFGRLPNLARLINAPAFRSGAIVGQLAGRVGIGGTVEYSEEFFQQAFPQVMVDLAEAMGADIPDVNWGDFWRDWKANQGELIATIIPLVLLGSGVGQFSDFQNSRALARDQDLLVAAGYSVENAAKIKEFTDAGKWGEAQDLMLKDWRAVNAKGVSIPEVSNEAATKILAEREEAREKVLEKLQQVQDDVGRIAAQGGYSLSKVAGGWQVTTPDSQVTVASAEEATALLQNHYNEAERENILAVAKLADELEKQGDTQRVEIKPGEQVQIKWEDNQQAVEVAARMAGLTPEQAKRVTFSVLGSNRFEHAEGLKRAVSTIFQGGNVLTMVEETVEGRFKRALDTGALTKEEATKMVQLAETIVNEGKTGADRQTIFDTQAADQDRALIEAVSKIVYLDVFGRRKEGGRFTPGLITRGLKAAVQMRAPTEALAFQMQQAAQGKVSEASQMHAFLSAFRTLFGSVFKAARALKQARAQGRTEELDTFINKLIGVQAEVVEQEATVQAAQDLLAEMPQLEGQPYETFSMRATPADASKVIEMPDGARLVGPTTFSIRAFHGTPHKVSRFLLEKIGTGEGRQVFGWGLYFARARGVAEGYQRALSDQKVVNIDGLDIYKSGGDSWADTEIPMYARMILDGDVDSTRDALNMLSERVSNEFNYFWEKPTVSDDAEYVEAYNQAAQEAKKELEQLKTDRGYTLQDLKKAESANIEERIGNLYTVELLPDEDNFLDWDKPLSEQSEKVRAALANIETPNKEFTDYILSKENGVGGYIYKAISDQFNDVDRGKRKTSELLSKAGIPGIRYLDGGSRADGEGTRNYVIFDENLIKILEENGKPVEQPDETFSMRVLMTRKALTDAALQQESWRDWYEEHQAVLDDFFGEYATLFQDILSITSQAASVKANVGLALKAFGLYVRGESFDARERGEEKPGFLPAVIMNLNRLREDKQIQGQKIKAYKASNEGAVDQAVIDRHITRLLFGVDTPSAKQFAKAQRVLSEIADDIGWTPRQVQAALWAHSIYKSGKTPESYGAYLTKLESKGTIAKRIGDLAGRGSSLDAASRGRGRFAPLGAGQAEVSGVISQTSNTAAETFSIKVQAANVLADSKNVPGILGDEFMGLPFLPIMADLISSGEAFGIPMQGGPAWPLLTHNPKTPNKTTAVWASSKKGVQQIYITLQKSGAIYTDKNGNKKAIVAPFAMSQDAHKSNITFQNIVFNAIEDLISNGQLTKEQESQLSKLVRKRAESTKGGTKKLLDFPEVFSAQQFDSYINSMSFTERAFVIDTMRSAQAQSIGLPSIEKILEQTRDVSFFGLSTGSIISFLEVDVDALEKGLAKGGSLKAGDFGAERHLSYDTIVPGKIIAHLRQPIPLPLVGNRMLEAMSKRPKQSRPDYLLQGSRLPQGIPAPLLDAETLNIINDSQTVGFSAAELKAVSAAVMDEWTVLDKTNAKGVVDFVRSLNRNEAAATLTQYDPSQLKKWLNIGHIEIFKLSEFDVWFGIKKGKLSADGKSVEDDGTRELIGVSSNVPTKGMLNLIMAKALEKGANKLDAFSVKSDKFPDGFLPTLYRNHGWEVVDSVAYDPLYKEKGDETTTEKLLDLDAKRKAVWSKTGWNVSRHGLPDVVFMQHGGIKNRRIVVTDAGSLAGESFQRFETEAESVAESERDAGETSADGAVAGGDAGNGRRVLPRNSDKLRRFLETASANRLALFGLSSAQRDQILQAFEAGITYSMRPFFEDRLTGVFSPLMRDPVIRRELAQRALEKAKSAAAKLGKLKKGDVTPQEQRDRTVAGLRVLNAALAAMPPVVRTRVGGFIAVAQRTTAEGMMREIERRIAKLDVELERYLAEEATQEAEDLFDRYKSQRDSGGRQAGKILASGTEQIDYALGIYDLDDDQQDTTIGGLQKRIDDADNADDLADAMNKLAIAELFSHWDKQDSESRYAAVDWMRDIIETGKLGRSIIDEERKQFLAALKEDARTSVLGDVRASLAEAENKDNQTDSSAWQTFVRNVKSAGGSLLWTTAQQIELLFGADSQVYKYFTDKIVEAANLSTDIKTEADKRRVAFMQQLFDTKSSLKLAQAMARLQKARNSGVFVNVGRVVEKVKIPVEVLERLSDGKVTPEDIGLNDAQAQQALEDFAAAGPMTRQIEVEKVVNAGEQVEKFMSEGQGIMWFLWSRQDVSRKQMERDGWNEDSLKQLDAFLSDEAKAIADFIAQDLQMAGDMIDPVYRRLFNAPMPRNKNYAPIYRLKPADTAAMDFEAGMSSGLDAGFTKARVNNSLPLREMDAFVVFLSHWEHVSHWVSHAELMRDMKSVMFDANVQNAIRTKSGKGALEGINNRLKAIESNGNRAAWDLHSVNKIWSNLTKFRAFKGLAFRVSPVVKQTSAFLNPLLADVPAHAYAIGLANAFGDPVNFASDVAAMWESPIIQRRLDGGFSAEARIAMGRAGITGSTLVAAMQKGMMPMAMTDAGWTALGAAISFRYYKKVAMREEGTTEEQANAIAMKRVERMIATSAQPADLVNRALIENQTNPIVKSLWMFASESRKSLAIELMAMRNLAKGKEVGMNIQRILVAHFVQAAVTQLMGSFLMSIMGDDDDKERSWSLDTWALSLALGPINGLFVLGSVIDTAARRAAGMYTFPSELLPGQVYSVTEKAVRNIDDLFQDDPDSVLDEIDKISAAVGTIMSTIFGPAGGAVDVFGNVARDARKIYQSQTKD